jgi:hypothetical protein
MMIDPRLLQAFRKTRFIASTPAGELILRVGEENHDLDDLLASFGAMKLRVCHGVESRCR